MKHAPCYVKETVRSGLLENQHTYRISFATGNCLVYYTLLEASLRARQTLPTSLRHHLLPFR